MFDATKSKFRSIKFEKLNIDEARNAGLKRRYNVNGIPNIVLLDKSDNVIYNGGTSAGHFAQLLSKHQ